MTAKGGLKEPVEWIMTAKGGLKELVEYSSKLAHLI